MSTSALVPSSQRPIPLFGRRDLHVERVEFRGVASFVVKDPVGLDYHRLEQEQYRLLTLLNGRLSLEELREELRREFPTLRLTLADVQQLVTDLYQKGLAYSDRTGQGIVLLNLQRKERKKKIVQTLKNLLYLKLPGWDPEPTFRWLYPKVRWMFHPALNLFAIVFLAAAWTLLVVQFDSFRERLPAFQQFFGWPNLIYLWIMLGAAKVIHEFGHGLTCKHYGGECHEMGVMLLVFTPCMYCDVSDSWMLKNKYQRMMIGAAGMWVEAVLSSFAIFLWWNTQPGLVNHLALNLFFITTVTTVIFNANPLMRFDGYYIFSDWLEVPNLRPKADKLLRDKFAWYCLGIETRPDRSMPETGLVWFVSFAVAAAIYRWMVVFGILLFLYTVLKPYGLQSIGVALALASLASIVGSLVYTTYRIISAPRSEPLSKPKISVTLSVLAILIVAALTIPLPLHVEAAFLIEPHDVQHVYATTPGRLTERHVKPGDRVSAGDLLVKLSNDEHAEYYRRLQVDRKVQEVEVELYQMVDDTAQKELARRTLQNIDEQISEYARQIEQLDIRAPIAGVVVSPPRLPAPKLDAARRQLSTWSGTPIDDKNAGCYLDARTHVLSIAPDDRVDAVLLVDQADRFDVAVDQSVEIKFEHLPNRTYTGTVSDISRLHQEYAPETLSNKSGGELATVTDDRGREKLASNAYQATVVLADDPSLLTPGLRGRARFVVDRRSAAGWIWRYIRQTLHFRL